MLTTPLYLFFALWRICYSFLKPHFPDGFVLFLPCFFPCLLTAKEKCFLRGPTLLKHIAKGDGSHCMADPGVPVFPTQELPRATKWNHSKWTLKVIYRLSTWASVLNYFPWLCCSMLTLWACWERKWLTVPLARNSKPQHAHDIGTAFLPCFKRSHWLPRFHE